jgi:hypothetical protein
MSRSFEEQDHFEPIVLAQSSWVVLQHVSSELYRRAATNNLARYSFEMCRMRSVPRRLHLEQRFAGMCNLAAAHIAGLHLGS